MKRKVCMVLMPFICSVVLAACSKNDNVKELSEGAGGRKGLVNGVVTDAKKLPVKDARITIEHTVWYNSYLFASSDNEGMEHVLKKTLCIGHSLSGDYKCFYLK